MKEMPRFAIEALLKDIREASRTASRMESDLAIVVTWLVRETERLEAEAADFRRHVHRRPA